MFAALCGSATAQDSVEAIKTAFDESIRDQLRAGGLTAEKQREGLVGLIRSLEAYLAAKPEATDRDQGWLTLAHVYRGTGEREKAHQALRSIDQTKAPALVLVRAAELASRIGMRAEVEKLVTAALAKEAPFADRMEMGKILLTTLHDPERGEKIFADALAAARSDEDKARVLWFQAEATREREDLLETDPYDRALEELGKKYPKTHYGSIAKDRHLARGMRVGSEVVPLRMTTVDGKPVTLAEHKGKVVLLDFWSAFHFQSMAAQAAYGGLLESYGKSGLVILGVNLDETKADFDAAVAKHKIRWTQVFEGKGLNGESALRFGLEGPAAFLIGRDGRLVAMNLIASDAHGIEDLKRAIEAALAAGN